ncbi:MAG: hypothetical protein AAF267_17515 [Deinococcota bacterium]
MNYNLFKLVVMWILGIDEQDGFFVVGINFDIVCFAPGLINKLQLNIPIL